MAFDFKTKLTRKNGTGIWDLDKTKKKDLIENKSEENRDYALEITTRINFNNNEIVTEIEITRKQTRNWFFIKPFKTHYT